MLARSIKKSFTIANTWKQASGIGAVRAFTTSVARNSEVVITPSPGMY